MVSNGLVALAGFITAVISGAGYLGVAGLMALESACVPLPSEIVMPFAGYLASTGRFSLFWVATAGAIGCNLGSAVAYYVVGRGGESLVHRWGSVLLISMEEVDWTKRFFARYGAITVFIGRLMPVVRTFIAVPAGLAEMPQIKFQAYTFVGSWIWCYALASIGEKLGRRWNSDPALREWFHRFDALILAGLLAAAALFVWTRLRRKPHPT
jgi:membrane protein DedA with SNARE-associated domain